jgi:hypothetical protein
MWQALLTCLRKHQRNTMEIISCMTYCVILILYVVYIRVYVRTLPLLLKVQGSYVIFRGRLALVAKTLI